MSIRGVDIGSTGLLAAQRAAEIASHNSANANTDGYTRQRVILKSAGGSPNGGVLIAGTQRVRDQLADLGWRAEASTQGYADARYTALNSLEDNIGDLGTGLTNSLDQFYSAFDNLALNPSDPAGRTQALAAATRIADEFRRTYQATSNVRDQSYSDLSETVKTINSLSAQVASLNGAIQASQASGAETSDLEDSRDSAIDQLVTLAGATVQTYQNGLVEVRLGGMPIVSATTAIAVKLSGTGNPGDPVTTSRSDGASLPDIKGKARALMDFINTDVPAFRDRLDASAIALRDSVNAVHSTGYDTSVTPAVVSGLDLFSGNGSSDLTVNPAVTADKLAASAAGSAGDGNNALKIAQLRDSTNPNGAPALARQLVAMVGTAVNTAKTDRDNATTVLDGLTTRRMSTNGVNTDEEMVDLVKFQRAYQASAKAIAIADDMLDTLINRLGL